MATTIIGISEMFEIEALIRELSERLQYNEDGTLTWKFAGRRSDLNGKNAGCLSITDGYVYIKFRQKRISAHRIVFFIHNKYFPKEIDHINRVRHDNRIENLRNAVNHSKNLGNQSVQKRNKTSIYKGVCWDANRGKWMASIKFNKKRINIGRFDSEISAAKAYDKYAISLFGEFANTNNA